MSCAACLDLTLDNGDTVRCCSGRCLDLLRFGAYKKLAEAVDRYLTDSAPNCEQDEACRRMANALNAVKKSVS